MVDSVIVVVLQGPFNGDSDGRSEKTLGFLGSSLRIL